MNTVCLVGRVASEIEGRTTTTGKNVSTFRIAVHKRIKPTDGSPDSDFFNVVAWGSTADFADNYLSKGRLISLEGRLQSRKYTTNEGSNREVVEIVAESVQALDRPREDRPGSPLPDHVGQGLEYDPTREEDPFAE